jgi:hypothetical protein
VTELLLRQTKRGLEFKRKTVKSEKQNNLVKPAVLFEGILQDLILSMLKASKESKGCQTE